ncbi:MAG TPA: hypothetical protein PLD62_01140 [Candidatus Cloacimonadota bacterium]|nr:hypothetical protein [Candidatus Cloacimonadota bacterium]
MEKLVEEKDEKPPSAGWYPALRTASLAVKKHYCFNFNFILRHFYHMKK